jgi:hypothetical protein
MRRRQESKSGLLRGACHRARIRATRWLAMTARYDFAISPRIAPEFCSSLPPSSYRGRRECRAPDAPAALRAKVESTQASHHGHTGNTRHSPRNGFTAYSALSLVTGLVCHHRLADHPAKLDASVGASGPHGFAVRGYALSSAAPTASIASPRPTSVTIAIRPSCGCGMTGNKQVICLRSEPKYFCVRGWTLSRRFARRAKSASPRSAFLSPDQAPARFRG